MRLFLLLIVFPFVHLGLFAQDDIQICYSGGKKGYWVFYGKDRPESGIPPEGKVEEGNYVNDRKEGTWIKYHNDGITPKLIGEYKNNRPIGNYRKFYPNGILKEIGFFEKNRYHDSLLRYYENGQREYAAYYDSLGKEHGLVQYWLPDGTLEFQYEAIHGVPTQKSRHLSDHYTIDDIKEPIQYAPDSLKPVRFPQPPRKETLDKSPAPSPGNTPKTHGVKWQPEGYNKVYNENDEIWQDGQFKNGILWDGKFYVYDIDGILLRVKIYKNGIYHSDGQL